MAPKKESKKDSKSKEPKAKAGAGKQKKKKWSKGKVKEKANNAVILDKAAYEKLLQDIPQQKLITVSGVSERMKVNGSFARRAIRDMATKGLIKKVEHHSSQLIYTRAIAAPTPAPTEAKVETKTEAKPVKGGKGGKGGKAAAAAPAETVAETTTDAPSS